MVGGSAKGAKKLPEEGELGSLESLRGMVLGVLMVRRPALLLLWWGVFEEEGFVDSGTVRYFGMTEWWGTIR